jgi:hypothetical protein
MSGRPSTATPWVAVVKPKSVNPAPPSGSVSTVCQVCPPLLLA